MISALHGLGTSDVADANNREGVLPSELRLLCGPVPVAGPALTADCQGAGVQVLREAVLRSVAGDVLVIKGHGEQSFFGEMLGVEAKRRGVVAVVVDGLVRDLAGLRALDLPTFARAVTPRSVRAEGSGSTGESLRIGSVTISRGDWIVGDEDGVVVVALESVADVAACAREIRDIATATFEQVRGGTPLIELAGRYGAGLRDARKKMTGGGP